MARQENLIKAQEIECILYFIHIFIYFRINPFNMAGAEEKEGRKALDSQEKKIFLKIIKETDGKVCIFFLSQFCV